MRGVVVAVVVVVVVVKLFAKSNGVLQQSQGFRISLLSVLQYTDACMRCCVH